MKNKILTSLLVCFVFIGCGDKEGSFFGVEIDKAGMKLVDTYLSDPELQVFYPKLKVSRANIIEDYEREYTKKYIDDVKIKLTYNKKTYDKDFDNKVEISIDSNKAHRVQLKSKYYDGIVNITEKGYVKTLNVTGINEKDLNITIEKILPETTEYITKNYKNL